MTRNVLLGIGLVALVAGVATAGMSRVWGTLILSNFFVFAIALCGIVLSGIQDLLGATWGRTIKRIHEGFSSFLPASLAIFAVFQICVLFNLADARDVYSWMNNPDSIAHFHGKNVWLTPKFFALRDLFAIGLLFLLTRWQLGLSTKRDLIFLAGDKEKSKIEANNARNKLRFWIAPILFIYALCFSLLAFDMLMSLSPTWFSTLWGGWLFAVMMQTHMATLLIVMFAMKKTKIGEVIARKQFHDVGKLMFGFTVFFAYLTFAHILTYWYGNMPEETEYFIERLNAPWFWIVVIAPFFSFVIPLYSLIFKAAKWTAKVTIPLASLILTAQWFLYVLIVMPTIDHHWSYAWLDVGGLCFIVGLAMTMFMLFARKNPMLGIGDDLLPQALEEHQS
jgi:hypothetical protein